MKKQTRYFALFLSLIMISSFLASCGKNVKNDSAYLSKREFINLFVYETRLPEAYLEETKVSIDKDDKCYEAARAIEEIGYMSDAELSSDLDKAVTKEFVATLCVRSLYFRKNFTNLVLKDAKKLSDPEACRDAVGHEIVADENGYFNAYKSMTYYDCMSAIDRTKEVDATTTFDENEYEFEVNYQDNVVDVSNDIAPEDIEICDPNDPLAAEILEKMLEELKQSENTTNSIINTKKGLAPVTDSFKVSPAIQNNNKKTSGNIKTSSSDDKPKVCSSFDDAETDELMMIKINTSLQNFQILEVGRIIVFNMMTPKFLKDNAEVLTKHSGAGYGEILKKYTNRDDPNIGFDTVYLLLRIPSEEEVISSMKLNKYTSSDGWNAERLLQNDGGLSIGPVSWKNGALSFSISGDMKTNTNSWRDPQFKTTIDYTFTLSNIKLTVDGFGDVLTGNIKNAVFKLDYVVTNECNIKQEARYTPDDNRNGRFPSNFIRSRWTGANSPGATSIKVARVHKEIGYGFNVEFYLHVDITLDGEASLRVETNYSKGFKIQNNKVTPISEAVKKAEAEIHINLEIALVLDINLRFIRKRGTPWVQVKGTIGVGWDRVVKFFVYDEDRVIDGVYGLSNEEAENYKKNWNIDWCYDKERYVFVKLEGLTSECRIGKVIRFFYKDFELSTGKIKIDALTKKGHYEDGKDVGTCTRDGKIKTEDEEKTENGSAGDFVLKTYKLIIPNNTCGKFDIVSYPIDEKKLDSQGGIKIIISDTSVAEAHYYGDTIVIESVGVGSTQMILQTGNGRYVQECSITVTEN